jgi:tetratricopeptide (TPR) repeat protein
MVDLISADNNTPKEWLGLTMFLNKQVRADTNQLKAVYHNFQKNMEDIRRVASKSRSKVIFCTVGGNLKDSPPFASLHRLDLNPPEKKKWEDIYQQGIEFELKADYTRAAECYLEAAKIDDQYADLQFRLGRCYWETGDFFKARERYIRARDLDTLRFRADTRINNIIRSIANDRIADSIYLIDTVKVFKKYSPHSTPGRELFYEHVHMNFKGNYLFAKSVFNQVKQILPAHLAKSQEIDKHQILTEDESAERLAYTGWDRYQIADKVLNDFIKHPPFTNQLYQQERLKQMEHNLEDLKIYLTGESFEDAVLAYCKAIQKSPSDWRLHWRYGKFLMEGLKDYKAAAEQAHLVRKYIPHSYLVNTALGAVARGLGDLDEVVVQYQEAIRKKPTCIEAHYYLAWTYQKQDKVDESIEYYNKTLKLQPTHILAYNNLVDILYSRGSIDQGIEVCRKALIFVPDSANLHCNLGIMLDKQGDRTEAIAELKTAMKLDPNSPEIRKVLEVILRKSN